MKIFFTQYTHLRPYTSPDFFDYAFLYLTKLPCYIIISLLYTHTGMALSKLIPRSARDQARKATCFKTATVTSKRQLTIPISMYKKWD